MPEDTSKPSRTRGALDRALHPYIQELQEGQQGILDAIQQLHGDLGRIHREVEEIVVRVKRVEVQAGRAAAIGRHVYNEEPANRRRLRELRESQEYELAFTEAEPLVSFIVPTYSSYETLRDIALPSILGQSYSNLEVIVAGDAAPAETQEAIEQIGDPRVRYCNRTVRGPYPGDPAKRWYVIGTPPFNDALAQVRGRWIAVLGDDDAVRPDHTERLLAAAREHRFEHCYGLQLVNFVEGEPMTLGKFPPELGEWGLQAAIYHAGLSFIESELPDWLYDTPNDWSMCERMLRAGVRTGMIEEIVVDKYETRRASSESWKDGGVPRVD
jgi:hypothetical protein